MSNRFEFEEKLCSCWRITDDIDLLCNKIIRDEGTINMNDVRLYLESIKTIYNLKFDDMINVFENMVGNREL